MRLSRVLLACLCSCIGNFLLLFYILHGYGRETSEPVPPGDVVKDDLTVVIYEFEYFENKVSETVESLLKSLPGVKILILSDEIPYPPLDLPQSSLIQEFPLHPFPDNPGAPYSLESVLKTQLALVLPDSTILARTDKLDQWVNAFASKETIDVLVFVVGQTEGDIQCSGLDFFEKEWTLEYTQVKKGSQCRQFSKPVALLTRVSILWKLRKPFIHPFFEAFFIQASILKWRFKFITLGTPFDIGSPLFSDAHSMWKHERNVQEQRRKMYESFGIKKVIHADRHVEWFGCTKQSARCFGTVHQDVPSYIYYGRWTPPCCLKGLRETAKYVFRIFEDLGVPYWLEGGSLLGAARSGDIIPWDYDVDLGMFQEDILRIPLLQRANSGEKVVDERGYVWEKAKEGDFFRVQYSQMNHLHVDIFPFFEENGVMTKNTWFKTHRQDTEFPAHFLRPLEKIDFVGTRASCPNNVRKFLEYKFGTGVIEHPQYPNPEKVKKKLGKNSRPIR